jgi:hypothetical protein
MKLICHRVDIKISLDNPESHSAQLGTLSIPTPRPITGHFFSYFTSHYSAMGGDFLDIIQLIYNGGAAIQ